MFVHPWNEKSFDWMISTFDACLSSLTMKHKRLALRFYLNF